MGASPSQPIHDIRLLHDQKVPMRDGVSLSADVYLPRSSGPWPVILTRTPYDSLRDRFVDWGVFWSSRGFAAVLQDVRGRFESEGRFGAYAQEGRDSQDTLAWVSQQPWCNGKIGMWGRSYGGITQWQMVRHGSPYLTCLVPHVISDDYYRDYHYVGGAFQLALSAVAMIIWESSNMLIGKQSAAIFNNRRFYRHLPLIDMDLEAIGREVPYWREWLAHPTNDAYWRERSTVVQAGQVTVPTFQQGGWFDPYVRSAFRNYNAIISDPAAPPQRVLIGPWSHDEPEDSRMGDLDFGPEAYMVLREEELRWYDYWLKGIDTGLLDEPPIRIFVMGINRWRYEQEWPLARTQYVPFYLHSGGRANSLLGDGVLSSQMPEEEPSDRYHYDPDDPVPTVGGVHSVELMTTYGEDRFRAGPVDQRPLERRDDLLVYTSEPLTEDLEVTGPIEVVLYAASSARDTDFTARLTDVYPDGRSLSLTEGIIRARFRKGDDRERFLERGVVEEYRFELYPTSNVFRRGHRIRVDISSSNFPRFSRNLNTGEDVATGTRWEIAEQTVFHDNRYPSRIILPVIPSERSA